jgi:ferrous iron transport protein B
MLTAVLRHMWDRAALFLQQAGTVILGINILLWFLASYPRSADLERPYAEARRTLEARLAESGSEPEHSALREQIERLGVEQAGARLRNSVAGHMGRWIEPIIRPLGFDWKIGVGIITSFAAREVFVSTMSVVYNVSRGEDTEGDSLALTLRRQVRPDGRPQYTMLMGISLMVFYVFALQCASTVVVVRRETNSWKWPLFQWAYLGALAWMAAFLTFQGGRLLGLQ